MADYSRTTRKELILLCKEKDIKGCSTKKKEELITLLKEAMNKVVIPAKVEKEPIPAKEKVQRLNYIGSKFQLLDWITSNIQEKSGWESFTDKRIADLFGGTGIVSHHFRSLGASIISNDAELFSSIITKAFTSSVYNDKCKTMIEVLNKELETQSRTGYITEHYSPYDKSERKFFTVENAQKIDYVRERVEELRSDLAEEDYTFILASLLVSADAISNVPAVYGCFLKNFKSKATKEFKLIPIHTVTTLAHQNSKTFNLDVLSDELLGKVSVDAVYLDPPYNERQYSKNYFPLNIIAKTPVELEKEPALKGKTGIPTDCFISPFCKKGKVVEEAFERLFNNLKTDWIFLSYNSESLVPKGRMLELMGKYGDVTVVERDYKRFKSFEYNDDKEIKEYLFCLKRSNLVKAP
jgi:adenine-specific DNA-methyltransferase